MFSSQIHSQDQIQIVEDQLSLVVVELRLFGDQIDDRIVDLIPIAGLKRIVGVHVVPDAQDDLIPVLHQLDGDGALAAGILQAEFDDVQDQFLVVIKETIGANTDNLYGQTLFQQMYYNLKPQEILDIAAKFPAESQEALASIKAEAENALKTQPGQPYIDIAQKNADGKEVTLKSVVETKGNKYVLIDFWASWCGPCMGEVPFLVDTYAKYHGKGFEIYGVSFDNDRDAWLKAVADKKMTWIHVSDVKGWDNQARHDYAVNGIPANFLVDCSTGKIVATNLRGEDLQAKIAELLD